MINKHSEKQYLELETNFINLFNAVESLLTITEGEDLNTDELKARHLGALSIRLNEITERFSKIKQGVIDVMFKGDAIHTTPKLPAVSLSVEETERLIECVEHFICMWEIDNDSSKYKDLLNKITLKEEQ
tara:strand:+ start:3698 stop:4087 length:390 start_codon:yes stop_codon:yes gene_type:complete